MPAQGGFRGAAGVLALVCAPTLVATAAEPTQAAQVTALGTSPTASPPVLRSRTCDTDSHQRSTPDGRFTEVGEGSVADRRLGLVWLRCALGQVWLQGTCAGTPAALNWEEARQAAARLNTDGQEFFDNWRLPRLHELATLVERQCDNPRIDLALFPGTPAAFFWSATPVPPGNLDAAYVLSFGAEGVGHDRTDGRHFVRLVRRGP